ncbi:MAG: hypothetical protein LBM01_01380 [Christensenellaceae bacterium]|nr:hypothetical protein [Christensenellaceae bacterium]
MREYFGLGVKTLFWAFYVFAYVLGFISFFAPSFAANMNETLGNTSASLYFLDKTITKSSKTADIYEVMNEYIASGELKYFARAYDLFFEKADANRFLANKETELKDDAKNWREYVFAFQENDILDITYAKTLTGNERQTFIDNLYDPENIDLMHPSYIELTFSSPKFAKFSEKYIAEFEKEKENLSNNERLIALAFIIAIIGDENYTNDLDVAIANFAK